VAAAAPQEKNSLVAESAPTSRPSGSFAKTNTTESIPGAEPCMYQTSLKASLPIEDAFCAASTVRSPLPVQPSKAVLRDWWQPGRSMRGPPASRGRANSNSLPPLREVRRCGF
jgi:hypothetical protein